MAQRRALRDEIVRRGLLAPEDDVEGVLSANRVRVNGAVVSNGRSMVAAGDAISVIAPPGRFVSRGGLKLEGALDAFGIDVSGRYGLDAGASTGGFTDCLLQRGVAHVVAVDVGRAQIHAKLLADEHVTSWESTNVSAVTPERLGAVPGYENGASIVVADLSFVSLAATVPALVGLSAPGADLVVMVKPQFEASREDVPEGGVVVDESVQQRAVDAVAGALVDAGCEVCGTCESPITGTEGNKEFFLWAVRGSSTHRQR
jgi:23S rRNA (cytidine1920-2'-O)/16S rRNA (cytidine1409-2'-O)-methyltransferase